MDISIRNAQMDDLERLMKIERLTFPPAAWITTSVMPPSHEDGITPVFALNQLMSE